ncbi:MAG: aspartate--tRNA(Asn) ligase [Candidatus Hermodarchaeota archaeon]|jgi:nondiscriminating aspartyl-tRNA synthetase|nr:aspartate--tRNA(Asn) ligase [Candidatus Hermodarchaeota archaeon]
MAPKAKVPAENPERILRRTHYSNELSPEMEGQQVVILGWVQRIRKLSKISFLIVRDREGLTQCTLPHAKTAPELLSILDSLDNEYAIAVQGQVKQEKQARRGVELIPDKIVVVNTAPATLPLDTSGKVEADIATRFDNRVIDLRRLEAQLTFKIQHFTVTQMRQYLEAAGFREIHTPKIVATATEGGADLFRVQYFEKKAFLAQSPQFYKQLCLVGGFDRVYEVAPVYRAEKHNTPRHLNEYTSFDYEMAWIQDEEDVMQLEEQMLHEVFTAVKQKFAEELEQLKAEIHVPKLPIRRIEVREAIELLKAEGLNLPPDSDIPSEGEELLYQLVKKETGEEFFFLTRYPTAIRPFYTMPLETDPTLTRGFDLVYRGMEVTTGSQRIHRYELLVEKLKETGLKPKTFAFYLEPFKYGAPPHGGLAIGMERLTMQMLGYANIREAVLFPRDRTRLVP